jgi:glycosyltransferase involved in cell wall biosynthesis
MKAPACEFAESRIKDKAMKILMIAPEPFFEPRGTPISVYQRLQALSVMHYEVDLLTYHLGQDVSIPGVVVHRGPDVPFIKKVKPGPSWAKAFLDILLFCRAVVLLCKNRYDVIHSHEEAAFLSVLLSKVFCTRHIYDMHSCLPQQLASLARWNRWLFIKLFEMLERWVINTCDAVITIGVDLEGRAMAINAEVKTVLIHNLPVHINEARANHTSARKLKEKMRLDGKLPVMYTGNFQSYQGLDLLLKSAKIVKEHEPSVSFLIVGGDPQQVEYWRNQSSAYGVEDSVLFTGTVPLAEAIAYLDVAEILVSPRTEGTSMPLKIYSYLHSGKPIVATDVAAHSQVLNAEIAVLVAPTEEAFANGILTLAQSPDLRRELGLRAQEFARERFNSADYVAKLERVYRELGFPRRPPEQAGHAPPSEQAGRTPESRQARSPQKQWLHLP